MALALSACASLRRAVPHTPPAAARLPVVTTVLPVTLFTRAVAGDCAQVTALIPAQSGLHDVQSRPADLAVLQRARVLVKNGLGLETFLDRLIAAASNPALRVIDSSQGVATLPAEAAIRQSESAADAHHQGHAHGSGSAHAGVNPHIWLDPRRAIQQVETIRDGLIAADPACAKGYRQRAERYSAMLRQLDRELERQLNPHRGQRVVAFHDVAPYFAQRYGLEVAFLVTLPEQNPSPQDMLRVSQIVRSSGLKALLSEPQRGAQSFNALARDLGVRVSVFDPLETASQQQSLDPSTYITVMRANVRALLSALGS